MIETLVQDMSVNYCQNSFLFIMCVRVPCEFIPGQMLTPVGFPGPRGDGNLIPLLGYQVVVSMGKALSGMPSESGLPFSRSENRSVHAHPDSASLKEFRTVYDTCFLVCSVL